MIRLPNTGTYSLELVTAQNGAQVVVCYSDATSAAYTGGTQTTAITSATTTTICDTPAASTVRDVDEINIKNTFAGSHTITVQLDVAATNVPIITAVLLTDESLSYTHGSGWQLKDASGNTKTTSAISSMTSAQLAAAITDETGSGLLVFATSPTFTTPILGAATATSINGLTVTSSTGTFTLTNGKTLAVTHGLTLSGTDSTVMTFPSTSATIARTDAANTFTGTHTFGSATSLLLGTAGSAVGSIGFRNATSGTATLAPPTGALGSITLTLPAVTGTLAILGANTFTAAQALGNNNITGIKTATFNGEGTIAGTTGAQTVDWTAAQNYKQTEPTGIITYTFTAPPGVCHLQLRILSDGTSTAYTHVWPASVKWLGSTWAALANKNAMINFWYDGTDYWAMGANEV